MNKAVNRGKRVEKLWKQTFSAYAEKYPELAEKYRVWMKNDHTAIKEILENIGGDDAVATRQSGNIILNEITKVIDNLFGGSADLAPSNLTKMEGKPYFTKTERKGSNIQFGIREHAMGGIVNGILCHGGLTAYCSTFFVFSDYMKNAIRMSAIMKVPAIYVFSHDSIGVGEDGPTHQPVEQLIGLRSIPDVHVFRPCDTRETAAAWYSALTSGYPTAICLTRQKVGSHCDDMNKALKGAYVLSDSKKATPDVLLFATGSEVDPTMKAKEILSEKGIDARVISVPSIEIFNMQSKKYRESVMPSSVKARVCVEAGSSYSWYQFGGDCGEIVGLDKFGVSGKFPELFSYFGFTGENIAKAAEISIAKTK